MHERQCRQRNAHVVLTARMRKIDYNKMSALGVCKMQQLTSSILSYSWFLCITY